MNRRNLFLVAGAALLGAALAVLSGMLGSTEAADALSAPARWIGSGLRELSLSGFWGNLAAWFVTLLVCALPVLLVLRCAARQRHPVLAVLAGAVCGLGVLAVIALLEPVSGIVLPLNRYTAFVAAVLGVPGVVLLLLLQLIL